MIDESVSRYIRKFPEERQKLALLIEQIVQGQKLNDRHNFQGHITGSAIVLSPDKKQVLLIYHKLFDRWQQPGGHWEDDEPDPLLSAQREAGEETGVKIGRYVPVDPKRLLLPLNIHLGNVPDQPCKEETAHVHYDFQYLFVAGDEHLERKPEESNIGDIGWFDLDAPEAYSIRSAIEKLQQIPLI